MKKKKSTSANINAKNASWSFDKKVPKNFSKHITKSVPFYLEGHEIICDLSDFVTLEVIKSILGGREFIPRSSYRFHKKYYHLKNFQFTRYVIQAISRL